MNREGSTMHDGQTVEQILMMALVWIMNHASDLEECKISAKNALKEAKILKSVMR